MGKRDDMVLSYFNQISCEKNKLVSVVIELLTQCNVFCKHCYLAEHNNKGLTTETVKRLLHDLRSVGVIDVTFTGGEIFLRKDIFEIIEEARKLYMRVFLLSNATLIDKEKAFQLKKLHIAQFSTTVFSLKPEIHDLITGVRGSHKKTLMGIQALKENNVAVNIKMPIMKYNVGEIREIFDFCQDNYFDFLASPNIFQRNDGDKSPELLQVNGKELYEAVKLIDELETGFDYGDVNNYVQKNKYDVPCIAIFSSLAIDSVGDVYPCNSFLYKVGNILETSINEIWNESEKLRFIKSIKRSDLTKCCSCEFANNCTRCPGMALAECNDMLGCDPFAYKLAQIRRNHYDLITLEK